MVRSSVVLGLPKVLGDVVSSNDALHFNIEIGNRSTTMCAIVEKISKLIRVPLPPQSPLCNRQHERKRSWKEDRCLSMHSVQKLVSHSVILSCLHDRTEK